MIRSTVVSLVALVVVFLVGATYLTIDVARVNPFRSDYTISAILESSGGLLDTSPVMLEGVPVGKVTSIRVTDNQLAVDMSIDSGYKIPRGSVMTIQNLSVAGEQYINFIPPGTTTSEYLRSGGPSVRQCHPRVPIRSPPGAPEIVGSGRCARSSID